VNARTVWNLFKYVLAFSLLGWVVYRNWEPPGGRGLHEVWQKHVIEGQPIHYGFLALGFSIYLVSLVITLWRWYFLVRAQDLPFTVPDAMRIGLVGFFFNAVMPGAVGGDVIKAVALAREQSRRTVAVATVIMDRIIGLWALVWFVAMIGGISWLLGLLDGPSARPAVVIVATALAIVGLSALVWLLLGVLPQWRAERFAGRLSRLPKVGHAAAEFWRAVWMYRCRQVSVAQALGLSLVSHVGFVLAFYCCARVLWDGAADNPLPTVLQHFLIVPIASVVSTIPLFPGGAGIGEAAFGGLYFLFGSAASNGILGSLVQRVVTWVMGLLGYLVYLRMRSNLKLPLGATPSPVQSKAALAVENGLSWHPSHSHQVVTP
jgi:uncharacterized protein (TIRG00374 family)